MLTTVSLLFAPLVDVLGAGAALPVDRELADTDVLRLVDAEYPGFDAYRQALDGGETDGAQRLLTRHFATRSVPILPPPAFPGLAKGNSTLTRIGIGMGSGIPLS